MLRLLERSIDSLDQRLLLLAPPGWVPSFFHSIDVNAERHQQLVREMQQMRGKIYLSDGAIRADQLSSDGRSEERRVGKGGRSRREPCPSRKTAYRTRA